MIGTYHIAGNGIKLCVEESILAKTIKFNKTFPWSKDHRKFYYLFVVYI